MTDPLQESMTQLGADLRAELGQLTALHDARAAERERNIDDLLNKQVDDAESQDKHRAWLRKFVWTPAITVLLGGGSLAGVHTYQQPPEVRAADVRAEVKTSSSVLARRVAALELALELSHKHDARMMLVLQDMLIHASDATLFIGGMLERIDTRARQQPIPSSVTDARGLSLTIKQSRTPFWGYDPTAPLANLK